MSIFLLKGYCLFTFKKTLKSFFDRSDDTEKTLVLKSIFNLQSTLQVLCEFQTDFGVLLAVQITKSLPFGCVCGSLSTDLLKVDGHVFILEHKGNPETFNEPRR